MLGRSALHAQRRLGLHDTHRAPKHATCTPALALERTAVSWMLRPKPACILQDIAALDASDQMPALQKHAVDWRVKADLAQVGVVVIRQRLRRLLELCRRRERSTFVWATRAYSEHSWFDACLLA